MMEVCQIRHNADEDHRQAYFGSSKTEANTAWEKSEGKPTIGVQIKLLPIDIYFSTDTGVSRE